MDAALSVHFVFEEGVDHAVPCGLRFGLEGWGCYFDAGVCWSVSEYACGNTLKQGWLLTMTVKTVVALAGLLSWARDMVDADFGLCYEGGGRRREM
jgi:hypothetical protein